MFYIALTFDSHLLLNQYLHRVVHGGTTFTAPVRLHDRTGGSKNDIKRSYAADSTPELDDLRDTAVQGRWQLRVRDTAGWDVGTLNAWSITLEF